MKRSEINARLQEGAKFFEAMHFLLPPFAAYRLPQWRQVADRAQEIFDLQLGWDLTTFGSDDFYKQGLLLFTLRNGRLGSAQYPKPYAEKIMMVRENQITPRHFHWHKREDIINRGGGKLVIELYHADPEHNTLVEGSFPIHVNGMPRTLDPGDKVILTPGESVCLEPIHAHLFYADPGFGPVLAGEVSAVNDDNTDNCFIDGVPRFDPVEEDVEPDLIPAADYARFLPEARHDA